jgi:hypothetical protein
VTEAEPIDNVVRKIRFETANPGVKITVERTYFLSHRAVWISPDTGREESVSSLSLGHLMAELEQIFGGKGGGPQVGCGEA